jgi:hypothetical protein
MERRFTRPATFEPPELALIYMALMAVSVPATRTRDHVSAINKLEAALDPESRPCTADGDYGAVPGRLPSEDKAEFQAAFDGVTGREGAPV